MSTKPQRTIDSESASRFEAEPAASGSQMSAEEELAQTKWLLSRRKPTAERIERARQLLRKAGNGPIEPGDELPEGYTPMPDRTA